MVYAWVSVVFDLAARGEIGAGVAGSGVAGPVAAGRWHLGGPAVRWIPGFIAAGRVCGAMDSRFHTRFPCWIAVSIAPGPARRPDGFPDPSPGAGSTRA